jgi:hypothetical protein
MSTSFSVDALVNYLKPHRGEAIIRIRTNAICLLGVSVLSYLLPIPDVLSATRQVFLLRGTERWDRDRMYSGFCTMGEFGTSVRTNVWTLMHIFLCLISGWDCVSFFV